MKPIRTLACAFLLTGCVQTTSPTNPSVGGSVGVVDAIISGVVNACQFQPTVTFVAQLVGVGTGVGEGISLICAAVNRMGPAAGGLRLGLSSPISRPLVKGIPLEGRKL
jgi:hypothetical protein